MKTALVLICVWFSSTQAQIYPEPIRTRPKSPTDHSKLKGQVSIPFAPPVDNVGSVQIVQLEGPGSGSSAPVNAVNGGDIVSLNPLDSGGLSIKGNSGSAVIDYWNNIVSNVTNGNSGAHFVADIWSVSNPSGNSHTGTIDFPVELWNANVESTQFPNAQPESVATTVNLGNGFRDVSVHSDIPYIPQNGEPEPISFPEGTVYDFYSHSTGPIYQQNIYWRNPNVNNPSIFPPGTEYPLFDNYPWLDVSPNIGREMFGSTTGGQSLGIPGEQGISMVAAGRPVGQEMFGSTTGGLGTPGEQGLNMVTAGHPVGQEMFRSTTGGLRTPGEQGLNMVTAGRPVGQEMFGSTTRGLGTPGEQGLNMVTAGRPVRQEMFGSTTRGLGTPGEQRLNMVTAGRPVVQEMFGSTTGGLGTPGEQGLNMVTAGSPVSIGGLRSSQGGGIRGHEMLRVDGGQIIGNQVEPALDIVTIGSPASVGGQWGQQSSTTGAELIGRHIGMQNFGNQNGQRIDSRSNVNRHQGNIAGRQMNIGQGQIQRQTKGTAMETVGMVMAESHIGGSMSRSNEKTAGGQGSSGSQSMSGNGNIGQRSSALNPLSSRNNVGNTVILVLPVEFLSKLGLSSGLCRGQNCPFDPVKDITELLLDPGNGGAIANNRLIAIDQTTITEPVPKMSVGTVDPTANQGSGSPNSIKNGKYYPYKRPRRKYSLYKKIYSSLRKHDKPRRQYRKTTYSYGKNKAYKLSPYRGKKTYRKKYRKVGIT